MTFAAQVSEPFIVSPLREICFYYISWAAAAALHLAVEETAVRDASLRVERHAAYMRGVNTKSPLRYIISRCEHLSRPDH